MDAKLNPIASSAAGTPLTGKSISAGAGQQTDNRTKMERETIQDTLETSDREADGRQAYEVTSKAEVDNQESEGTQNSAAEQKHLEEQGGLLDLEG